MRRKAAADASQVPGGFVRETDEQRPISLPVSALRSLPKHDRLSDPVRVRLFLAIVLGLGAFLRLWQLDALGFNSDEAVYAGQAAAIAQDPTLQEVFPVFRAHPLLFQFTLALAFRLGVGDLLPRLIAVVAGLATIWVVYRLGSLLYGEEAGVLSAFFLALMPYHVVATRQALLDGPMTLLATLTLYYLARFAATQRAAWLCAAGAGMGLTFLAKETSVVLLGSIYAFLALSAEVRTRLRDVAKAMTCMAVVIAPFPLTLILAGGRGTSTARQYLAWQLFRRPNHDWTFYLTTFPVAAGPLLVLAALAGLWVLRRQNTWREKLLVSWIMVPTLYFQLWPVKGFQYLLPLSPPIAILGARTLVRWVPRGELRIIARRVSAASLRLLSAGMIALTLLLSSLRRVQVVAREHFLAGSGGVPGGREAGNWIRENAPEGATLMTIGPSMANILQFYGHRRAYGLSVSPNPLHRNPSYQPIDNPDLQIRNSEIQYLVWDAFSAARSSFFSEKLLTYAQRYNGRVVRIESVTIALSDGATVSRPVVIIYAVHP
jgi:hypothetical protein